MRAIMRTIVLLVALVIPSSAFAQWSFQTIDLGDGFNIGFMQGPQDHFHCDPGYGHHYGYPLILEPRIFYTPPIQFMPGPRYSPEQSERILERRRARHARQKAGRLDYIKRKRAASK